MKLKILDSYRGRFILGIFIATSILQSQGWAAGTLQRINEQGMTLNLSLQQAIDEAKHNNVMLKVAEERIHEAQGRRLQNDSDLLPHISVAATQGRVFWDNFASQGLPSFGVIGPFNTFDARFQLTQRIFDLSAISKFQAANEDVAIARLQEKLAQQQVITAAVMAYMDVLQAQEQLRAVEEDVKLAGQLTSLAQHQLEAGIVTRLDFIRAQTHLAVHQARKQQSIQGVNTANLRLERITGIALGSELHLSDSIHFFEEKPLGLLETTDAAIKGRIEMSIAEAKIKYGQYLLAQANRTRLPRVEVYGDYGQSAVEPNKYAHRAAQIALNVRMPIFEGGLIEGDIRAQRSLKNQALTMRDDMKTQVEEDARLSLQTLATITEQVKAAQEALELASKEVDLAKNEYSAGVGNNVAVVDAQATLENSRQFYVTALTQYHLARLNYYSALGQTESFHLNPS
ncbi:MAG: TolC family protein [Candidatus Omnitrophica bacterium]|nr:TolC family protein [Candidatus Omnitrophota bacterium]